MSSTVTSSTFLVRNIGSILINLTDINWTKIAATQLVLILGYKRSPHDGWDRRKEARVFSTRTEVQTSLYISMVAFSRSCHYKKPNLIINRRPKPFFVIEPGPTCPLWTGPCHQTMTSSSVSASLDSVVPDEKYVYTGFKIVHLSFGQWAYVSLVYVMVTADRKRTVLYFVPKRALSGFLRTQTASAPSTLNRSKGYNSGSVCSLIIRPSSKPPPILCKPTDEATSIPLTHGSLL